MPTKTRRLHPEVKALPPKLRGVAEEIITDPSMNEAVVALKEREQQFSSPLAAMLVGIGADDRARIHFDRHLDAWWAENDPSTDKSQEVIVGGGLHAAVYCAARVQAGFPKPLVIEKDRVGGVFAVSRNPSFYLNSRNSPGGSSVPGREGALNYLPASIIQPSDMSGAEYQRNTDLAWVIRVNLAMHAKVLIGEATNVRPNSLFVNNRRVAAKRTLVATGLGDPVIVPYQQKSDRVLTFAQFMAGMDKPFPLRGMDRVAVIGAGDSGKTVIEALTGQGPTPRMSVASLDWPRTIDWYGVPADRATKETWEACSRSRYKGIGRLLRRTDGRRPRANVNLRKAQIIAQGYACVFVDEIPYDQVIVCAGYRSARETVGSVGISRYYDDGEGRRLALNSDSIFRVGPAAELPLEGRELEVVGTVKENGSAFFRYAQRTATLAQKLN